MIEAITIIDVMVTITAAAVGFALYQLYHLNATVARHDERDTTLAEAVHSLSTKLDVIDDKLDELTSRVDKANINGKHK